MLQLAYPAQQDDDVILKVHVRCRACLNETFPLVPISRLPPGRSEKAAFMARHLWERMLFQCNCGHDAADLVTVDYAKAEDFRAPEPTPIAPPEPKADEIGYTFVRDLAPKPILFPHLGLPRLMRCG